MATDVGTPAASTTERAQKGGRGWRIFRLVLIGAIVSAALLIAFPPTGLIKDQLARSVGAAIGRTVTIGDMRLKLRPKLDVELDNVTISNPPGMPERNVLEVATVKSRMDLLPLIKGRVRLDTLDLVKPVLALEEDATGVRNWVFTTATASSATPAAGAQPVADPATTPAASPVAALSLPPVTTITDGTLTFDSAKTGAHRGATAITSVHNLDRVGGGLVSKGQLTANGEAVTFDVALGDFDAMVAGETSTLTATLDGRPLKASLEGDANFSAAAEFKGALSASTSSLAGLAQWLGAGAATQSQDAIKSSLEGKVLATTTGVTFTETDVMVNTTTARFDGTLDLSGARPKLGGAIVSEHVDLDRIAGTPRRASLAPEAAAPQTDFEPQVSAGWQQLLDDLTVLERGPQAAPQAAAAATPASPGWSEEPFNLSGLKTFDLDLAIEAKDITYGALDLSQGRAKAVVTDGVLDAKLEELAVGGGKAVGALNIDSVASPPKLAVQLSMTDVAAEPIITQISGKPLLAGTSNVEINATAQGQNQSQLTSTLAGKAHFRMGQGALRGFDVRRMIFEWWKSWSFDLSQRTGFTRLEAQYDIKKGIMRSQPGLEMGGSEVQINSAGTVNVPDKRLNQEIRVKAIPPPTAFPIPVKISGSWVKPSIGIDWGGLFSSAPGLGGPQALAAAPEQAPANVQAAIRRVLEADLPADRLTPEARQMLQSLLPPDPAVAPPAPAEPDAPAEPSAQPEEPNP